MKKFLVHGHQIFADDLQGRLEFRRRDEKRFVQLANPPVDMDLQLLVTAELVFGIGMLLFERVHDDASIVAILFEDYTDLRELAGLRGTAGFGELGVAQLFKKLGFVDGIRFCIEMRLQVRGVVGGDGRYGQRSEEEESEKWNGAGDHELLPFRFQHMAKDLTALLRLPNLVGIFTLFHGEKFVVSLQGRLELLQLIVTETTDKPGPRRRGLSLGNEIEGRERGRTISRKIVGGAQIFPKNEVIGLKLQSGPKGFFRVGKIALLQIGAAQTAKQLGIAGSQGYGLLERDDGIVEFLPGNLNIGAELEGLERRRLSFRGAVQSGEGFVIFLLVEEGANVSRFGSGILGMESEIFLIGVGGFGPVLGLQALRQAQGGGRGIGIDFEGGPEFGLGVGRALKMEIEVAKVEEGLEVAGVEAQSLLERLGGSGGVARTLKGHGEEDPRPTLRRKELNGFAEWRDGSGGFAIEQQNAEVELGFGQFGVELDGTLVLGPSIVETFQSGVNVSELEMAVRLVGFFGNKFLERRYGSFEVILVDGALRFVEEIVKRIGEFLGLRLGRARRGGLRE